MKLPAYLLCLLCIPVSLAAQAPTVSNTATNEWSVAKPAEAGLSAEPLNKMETAIQSGDLKKITSVLIARHGKLVYENYFNGSSQMHCRTQDQQRNRSPTYWLESRSIRNPLPVSALPFFHSFPTSNRSKIPIPVNPK